MPAVTLTQSEQDTLAEVADLIIPASDTYGVPSAADPAILAEILAAAYPELAADLATYQKLGADQVETFRRDHSKAAGRLQRLVAQCYYRDDRVMTSLGLEPRPPFPKGFDVEQGDWSLLDPVRAMKPLYRPIE